MNFSKKLNYRQHSPKAILPDNIPGRALRALLKAGREGYRPTYGELQAIGLSQGYEFNNASAAVSQLRELLIKSKIGTVRCCGGKPGKLHLLLWSPVKMKQLLKSLRMPFNSRWPIYSIVSRRGGRSSRHAS